MKIPLARQLCLLAAAALAAATASCIRVKPIEVKPIEVNINVRVTIDRELDDFFGDLDAKSKVVTPAAGGKNE